LSFRHQQLSANTGKIKYEVVYVFKDGQKKRLTLTLFKANLAKLKYIDHKQLTKKNADLKTYSEENMQYFFTVPSLL
jgi:hypothetical protein